MFFRTAIRTFSTKYTPVTYRKSVPVPRDPSHTVEYLLKTVRRECDQYIDKFTSWEHLFTATSAHMERLGIHCRARKKILMWTEKYR